MARKVFISVLGTGFYNECFYTYKEEDFESSSLRFIQEATLSLIGADKWDSSDHVLILVTQKSLEKNWENSEITDNSSQQKLSIEGLKSRLNKMKLRCNIQSITIPDGKSEDEMWEIFQTIFDHLEENDELFFDVTHGFRYLPMLVLVLCNYSKFLKNINVRHISYGNFEARNQLNEAPIINLNTLSTLQDWASASAVYLKNGNVGPLVTLCNNTLKPILRTAQGNDIQAKNVKKFAAQLQEIVDDRTTCRGIEIVKSEKIKNINELISELKSTSIKPFDPIFDRLKHSFEPFDETENVMNGFKAANWCLQNELYQQAITIFHENITTYLCHKIDGFDWHKIQYREVITTAFAIHYYNLPEEEWKLPKGDSDEVKKRIKIAIQDPLLIKLATDYKSMNDLRNDINHSGMNDKPLKPARLKMKIVELTNSIINTITEYVD